MPEPRASSLPIGFSNNGLPVGVQFAIGAGGAALLLAPASQLEPILVWKARISPIWAGALSGNA